MVILYRALYYPSSSTVPHTGLMPLLHRTLLKILVHNLVQPSIAWKRCVEATVRVSVHWCLLIFSASSNDDFQSVMYHDSPFSRYKILYTEINDWKHDLSQTLTVAKMRRSSDTRKFITRDRETRNWVVCMFLGTNLLEESQKTSRMKSYTVVHPNDGLSEM